MFIKVNAVPVSHAKREYIFFENSDHPEICLFVQKKSVKGLRICCFAIKNAEISWKFANEAVM